MRVTEALTQGALALGSTFIVMTGVGFVADETVRSLGRNIFPFQHASDKS